MSKTLHMKMNRSTEKKAMHEQIAARAYQLWEKAGRISGHELEFWLQAEKDLQKPYPAPHARRISS